MTEQTTKNDWEGEERREHERRGLDFYLRAYDAISGELLGDVTDLSLGGARLTGTTPIALERRYRLRMDLALAGHRESIGLDALSVWASADLTPAAYDTGFGFVGMTPELTATIQGIIDRLLATST
ncbi:MAG: PilZ domain-containing protein [Gammaproteobacteria bacterium]